jgi:hypothetical protein
MIGRFLQDIFIAFNLLMLKRISKIAKLIIESDQRSYQSNCTSQYDIYSFKHAQGIE